MPRTPSLALRYVVCDACGTVFALPNDPVDSTACGHCGARPLRELRGVYGPEGYFSP